jgi:Domain of unknown function (DUF932)
VCRERTAWCDAADRYSSASTNRADGVDAQRTFKCRHTGGLHQRLHEARRVMQITIDYAEQFKRMGDRLALEPITERALRTRVLDRLFSVEDDMGDRAARNREQAKQAVIAIFLGQVQRSFEDAQVKQRGLEPVLAA